MEELRSGHIWELSHATDQDSEVWTCWKLLKYHEISRISWVLFLCTSEGGETPELFESEFWVASAVSVSRNGTLIHCYASYAILPGGAFWRLQLPRWATSTSLGVLWWFPMVSHKVWLVLDSFKQIMWIDKSLGEKNHQRPTNKTFACSSLARLQLDGGGWYRASLLFF